jgi:hypothetical protein
VKTHVFTVARVANSYDSDQALELGRYEVICDRRWHCDSFLIILVAFVNYLGCCKG